MLKEDAKKFYRHFGTKNIVARESFYTAKLEPYWKSMLGVESQLNDRNECVKFRRLGKWIEMDFGLIRIMKPKHF